jgi:hypothetical protein
MPYYYRMNNYILDALAKHLSIETVVGGGSDVIFVTSNMGFPNHSTGDVYVYGQ